MHFQGAEKSTKLKVTDLSAFFLSFIGKFKKFRIKVYSKQSSFKLFIAKLR